MRPATHVTTDSAGSTVRRGGFTLIELLVVIAIIALLISILLPSLQKARQQSKRSVCLAHVKALASASVVYASEDEGGWAIPVHHLQFAQDPEEPTYVGAYEWGGKSGVGETGFCGGGQKSAISSKYGTRCGFGPGTRPLNPVLYKSGFPDHTRGSDENQLRDTTLDLRVFRCPGDDGPPRGGHCFNWVDDGSTTSYDWFGNSYAANVFLTGSSGGTGKMQSNSPYLRPITRVPNPARTLYFEENIGRFAWAARRDQCQFLQGIDTGPFKTMRGWHGQDWTYTRSFVDGHAAYQRILVEGTRDANGYYEHYRPERLDHWPLRNKDCRRDPGTERLVYGTASCIIVRGDGWQKDTLPAPRVCTNLNVLSGPNRPSYEGCVSATGRP